MKSRLLLYTPVCCAMALFGMSFVWTEGLLTRHRFPPQSLIAVRLLVAAAVLCAYLIATRRFRLPAPQDIKWFMLLALFEPFIYFIGETNGLRITQSPSLGSIIIATIPLFTIIACRVFYAERPTPVNVAGMLLTLPGVGLVMINSDFTLHAPLSGILLLFMAAASTAGYAVVVRKLEGYSPTIIVTYQNLTGALYFVPLSLGFEREALTVAAWHINMLYPLLMLSVAVSALGFVLFVLSVKKIGVAQSNMFTALVPVTATIAAVLMRRETIAIHQMAGVAVVLCGVALSQKK